MGVKEGIVNQKLITMHQPKLYVRLISDPKIGIVESSVHQAKDDSFLEIMCDGKLGRVCNVYGTSDWMICYHRSARNFHPIPKV